MSVRVSRSRDFGPCHVGQVVLDLLLVPQRIGGRGRLRERRTAAKAHNRTRNGHTHSDHDDLLAAGRTDAAATCSARPSS